MAEGSKHTVTLYKRQRQIVEFISQFIQRNGYSPTLREIADAMGLSSLATVHEHVDRLCKKGVLRKNAGNKTRGIIVVDETLGSLQNQGVTLPLLGWLMNNKPIEPYNNRNAKMQVAAEMISGAQRAFILEVHDNSLVTDGILKGDRLILEETAKIKDGDIIVAILESGNAVLKRFFKEATMVRLESITTSEKPSYAARIAVQGKVLGVIRMFEQFDTKDYIVNKDK